MGNFYVNLLVKGIATDVLKQHLATWPCATILLPEIEGHSFVYADFLGSLEAPRTADVTRALSALPGAAYAMVSMNMDDDVFVYELWARGARVDAFISQPDAFEPDEHDSEAPRGDPARLRTVFPFLEEVEMRGVLDRDDHVFELERHQEIFRLLRLPFAPAAMDYNYLQSGELPKGVDASRLVRIGG